MSGKALEWAHRLRRELAERIDELQMALADIEPLRQELGRLEAQLKGVERLIAVYANQLGLGEAERLPAPPDPVRSIEQVPNAAEPAARPPLSLGEAAAALGQALRIEARRMVSATAAWVASKYVAMRLWLAAVLLRSRAL